MFHCFFFNDTATTEIYTLSLHDALPISAAAHPREVGGVFAGGVDVQHDGDIRERERLAEVARERAGTRVEVDRKSTRLNSSHANISYAVFCLKKKKAITDKTTTHT